MTSSMPRQPGSWRYTGNTSSVNSRRRESTSPGSMAVWSIRITCVIGSGPPGRLREHAGQLGAGVELHGRAVELGRHPFAGGGIFQGHADHLLGDLQDVV